MEIKFKKFVLGCFCGGGLGSLVGVLVIQASIFGLSWLGFILGFLAGALIGAPVAYLFCDWHKVRQAIPRAWRQATSWRPTKLGVKIFFSWALLIVSFVLLVAWFFILPCSMAILTHSGAVGDLFAVVSLCALILVFPVSIQAVSDRLDACQDDKITHNLLLAWVVSPIRLPGWTLIVSWRFGLLVWRQLIKPLPRALRVLGSFTKNLFILIHSELRLMCLIDSCLGIFVGCLTGVFVGQPVIGPVIGAAIGAVSSLLIGTVNYKFVCPWLQERMTNA